MPTLTLPFSSQKFIDTWNALCEEKEWKKKTRNALQLALNKLGRYHEDFAIELIEKTIAGGWKGVVFDDTDAKYQEWKSARQQRMDNAMPRTAMVNKPRQLPADNNVDAMYARLRAKKEAEERELGNSYNNSMVTLTDRQAVKMIADIERLMRSADTLKRLQHIEKNFINT